MSLGDHPPPTPHPTEGASFHKAKAIMADYVSESPEKACGGHGHHCQRQINTTRDLGFHLSPTQASLSLRRITAQVYGSCLGTPMAFWLYRNNIHRERLGFVVCLVFHRS